MYSETKRLVVTDTKLQETTEGPKTASTSLRERNKEKKRAAMIKATRELLLIEGYDGMTMEAIAERAEVGVATVYKYFSTKDGLVMELVRGEMEEMLEQVSKIIANPPGDLADAMVAVLAPPSNLKLARGGASLVRHLIDEMWHKQGEVRRELARWSATELQARIEALLADFQFRGALEESVDTWALARIIYALFDYNYIRYARGEIVKMEEMAELTENQVRLLFDNWST